MSVGWLLKLHIGQWDNKISRPDQGGRFLKTVRRQVPLPVGILMGHYKLNWQITFGIKEHSEKPRRVGQRKKPSTLVPEITNLWRQWNRKDWTLTYQDHSRRKNRSRLHNMNEVTFSVHVWGKLSILNLDNYSQLDEIILRF